MGACHVGGAEETVVVAGQMECFADGESVMALKSSVWKLDLRSGSNRRRIATLQSPFIVSFYKVLGVADWARETSDRKNRCEK